MKPASRIQATIEILGKTGESRIPMDSVVGDYMRQRRYIGAKDRSEIAERIYAMARSYARLGWWVERLSPPDAPRSWVIAQLMLGEGVSLKRLEDLFDGSNYAPESLTAEERDFAQKLDGQALEHADMPEAVRLECPGQHEEALRRAYGDDFAAELRAMLEPAPLDLRVNTFLIDRDSAAKSLAKDGVETDLTPYSPYGLRARDKAFLSKTKAFHKGWVAIQDEGSQLIAHICGPQPGMHVLDFCAGGGGKTLALAAAMQRKGRIVAMDMDEKRLERGRIRYKKAQLADIIEIRPLSDEKNRKWLRRQKATFDVTLLDVPCSGSGTWRRNPDLRWRQYGPDLDSLTQTQREILDRAAPTVKPGGKLVYATCSLFAEENERQVEAFLERNSDFALAPLDEARGIGSPYLRLSPYRHRTDGFFAAVMLRKADQGSKND